MKRLLASVSIILLITTAFVSGYFKFTSISVFADSAILDVPDGYSPAGLNDQVDAFKYYCKSRNLAIDGSVADAVTSFTTNAYQNLVQVLGLDINELQNQIYKNTGDGQKFFFTVTGISAMNRIFAEFLQNNDLEVGDTVAEQTLQSGQFVITSDGTGAFVYIVSSIGFNKSIVQNGTTYVSGSSLISSLEPLVNGRKTEYQVTVNNVTRSYIIVEYITQSGATTGYIKAQGYYSSYGDRTGSTNQSDEIYSNMPNSTNLPRSGIVFCKTSSSNLYLGAYNYFRGTITAISQFTNAAQTQNANVYITTNNTTINNNNYEGDTIINNEGKVTKPDKPIPDPNDNHSTTTDPVQPDTPDSDSNLTFPLIDLDIPSIDWSLGDLSDKFPFSIPFDLIAFFTVLNAEPETPELKGQIDLGIVTWDIDWNLSDFDDIAKILRNLEFIGFCIGLILITRSLIKG